VVGLLGIAAINPDAWIAQHNLDRYEATGKLDVAYLTQLSADALPTLASLEEPLRACVFSHPRDLDDDALEWNLGRARAREVVDDKTYADVSGDCAADLSVE
jgi:hypothetical protein